MFSSTPLMTVEGGDGEQTGCWIGGKCKKGVVAPQNCLSFQLLTSVCVN